MDWLSGSALRRGSREAWPAYPAVSKTNFALSLMTASSSWTSTPVSVAATIAAGAAGAGWTAGILYAPLQIGFGVRCHFHYID